MLILLFFLGGSTLDVAVEGAGTKGAGANEEKEEEDEDADDEKGIEED